MEGVFPRPVTRMLLIGVLFIVTTTLPAPGVSAQQNPFFSGGTAENSGPELSDYGDPSYAEDAAAPADDPARKLSSRPLKRLSNLGFTRIARLQRRLYESITSAVESLGRDPSFGVVSSLFGIMFLYGFIHAVGPGHRKVVLTSYFISESVRPLPGILMAGGVALLHGVSAIVLIGTLYFSLDRTIGGSFNAASLLIERISYGILILLGGYLIVHTVREGRRHEDGRESSPQFRRGRGLAGKILFVVTNGVVPCPGAAMVLVFTFTYGLYSLGIFSVLAMSIGMGMLLASVAVVVIFGKERGLRRLLAGKKGRTAMRILEITGGSAVVLFGLILLLGSL